MFYLLYCLFQLCPLIAILLFCFLLDFAPCLNVIITIIYVFEKQCSVCTVSNRICFFYFFLHFCSCFVFVSLLTTCVWYIRRVCRKETKNCMCCSSWLQYRICHSLSTIQYVLVPQVQRQLQSARLRTSESRSS